MLTQLRPCYKSLAGRLLPRLDGKESVEIVEVINFKLLPIIAMATRVKAIDDTTDFATARHICGSCFIA